MNTQRLTANLCAALAPGTPLAPVPSNFEFAQLAPGVLAIVSQMDQQYLTSPPVTEASPATPQGETNSFTPINERTALLHQGTCMQNVQA